MKWGWLASQPHFNSPVRVKPSQNVSAKNLRIKCVLFLFTRFRDIQEQESFGIDDVTLITISTKDLNKILRTLGITKKRSKEIKIERRRLKNREYAANCRANREAADRDNRLVMTHISYRSTFPWIPDILEREELIRISDEIIAAYNKLRRLRRLTQVTHFCHEIARVADLAQDVTVYIEHKLINKRRRLNLQVKITDLLYWMQRFCEYTQLMNTYLNTEFSSL